MKKLTFYLSLVFLCACSSIKYVSEDDLLLTANNVVVDSVKKPESDFYELLLQKPNAKALGIPVSLYFYNLGNPKGPEEVLQWKKQNPNWYKTFKFAFSEKQSISVAKSAIGFNHWFLNNGQAPVTIDEKKIKDTEKNLKNYFFTEGYFKSKVTSIKDSLDYKKGSVTYFIEKGKPTTIKSVSKEISSPVLDYIFKKDEHKSFLKKGEQYKNKNFINEADRLVKLYRNKGIFHFNENSIIFNNDTLEDYKKTKVTISISDRIIEKNGDFISKPYKKQKLKSVNVYTDFLYTKRNEPYTDSITYNNINFFYRNKLKYKPKLLSQSVFIKPNQLYTDTLRHLTRNHLRNLKNFKSTSIRYTELNDEELQADIYLTPSKKYTLSLETELSTSDIRQFDISPQISITNRNIFKGAELFKFSISSSFFNTKIDEVWEPGWELGGNVSLEVPRFMAPFGIHKFVSKRMYPRTSFHTGINIQRNIALDKQNISLGIDYKWQPSNKKNIQLEIINTQYIRNLNADNYFNIYSSEYNDLEDIATTYGETLPNAGNVNEIVRLMRMIDADRNFNNSNPDEFQDNQNILNRYNIITSDFLIPEIAYKHSYNSQENIKDADFYYFSFRLANSGNVLGFLSNQTNDKNKFTVLDLPLAQYYKTDIEYKKIWKTSETTVLAHRTFLGAIFTYNNSDIPFSRSYFAGGSNDIRAWQTYELGPGTRPQGLEYNIGSLKFLSSFEYRFDLIGDLKSALFVDGGNIWDITNSSLVDDESKFKGIQSIADIAIGGGLGFRYDFKFLIARLDLGFKFKEPYRTDEKWFRKTNFSNVVYNIGINYPF